MGLHAFLRDKYPILSKNLNKQYMPTSLKFMVVRHPFERIASAYADKLQSYNRDLRYRSGLNIDWADRTKDASRQTEVVGKKNLWRDFFYMGTMTDPAWKGRLRGGGGKGAARKALVQLPKVWESN